MTNIQWLENYFQILQKAILIKGFALFSATS
jgi:hypothetical protein